MKNFVVSRRYNYRSEEDNIPPEPSLHRRHTHSALYFINVKLIELNTTKKPRQNTLDRF